VKPATESARGAGPTRTEKGKRLRPERAAGGKPGAAGPASESAWGGPTRKGMLPLSRALSKLGILSRAQASAAITAGRVRVNGRIVLDPRALVRPERMEIMVDGERRGRAPWTALMFNKPRGVVTTRSDPEGRRTIYDVIGPPAAGLSAVGRLDLATGGRLLLTNDTRLGDWIADPTNGVARVYIATVQGRVTGEECERMQAGIVAGGALLRAHTVKVRKASDRESHLIVDLREGKNREVRRLLESAGHPVTRLSRVRLGGLSLGDLQPGACRALTVEEIAAAFPGAPVRTPRVSTRPER